MSFVMNRSNGRKKKNIFKNDFKIFFRFSTKIKVKILIFINSANKWAPENQQTYDRSLLIDGLSSLLNAGSVHVLTAAGLKQRRHMWYLNDNSPNHQPHLGDFPAQSQRSPRGQRWERRRL